jgi:succinyl-diaminopimelate desuccinylase
MSDPVVERIQQWLQEHEQELLDDYRTMLRFPSLEGPAAPNAPFGTENRKALDFALSLGEKFGMRTKDLDGYIGYAEVGQGPLIVSLGHLDVVPVGPGWKHEPFGAEIDGDYVYARGAVDDKGPTMASFYAVRAIKECVPELSVRIRQVFGCNEESGFKCVEHYMQVEEPPVLGIAPDSDWPLIHAEKGISTLFISVPLNSGNFKLLSVEGGQRPNIVIDSCQASVQVAAAIRPEVDEKLADSWDKNVTWNWDGDRLDVHAAGKAAHGSTPFYGDSAATRLFRFLFQVAPYQDAKFFEELFYSTHSSGAGLGIHGRDDASQDLTNNLGVVSTNDGKVHMQFNIRYPVTWKGAELRDRVLTYLEKMQSGWHMDSMSDSPSLYFPLEHPLVQAIVQVYAEETGTSKEPGVMGGGTYARAIPNTVSIGTCWEGDGRAHETDERLKIEHLYKASRIYAHILYRMAALAATP